MRVLAQEAGAVVVSADDPLAPEHPFPAGLQDGAAIWAALRGVQGPFDGLTGPWAISGDSAGANIARAVLLDENAPPADGALLFYGVYGADFSTASYTEFAEGPGLTRSKMQRYFDWYAAEGQRDDPRVAPLRATDAALQAMPPTYFACEEDYTGFYLHHCVHYMDLMPWLVGSPLQDMTVLRISPAKGRVLFHMGFACENGAIGNVVMGTLQSHGTPMEQITVMGDHNRVEVSNVINVAWQRDPPFKADDKAATLDPASDTLCWTPNFTAAANEDHKGYAALLADVAAGLSGAPSAAPMIANGVTAMATLDRMIALLEGQS
ncbi:hypothetical protein EYC08_08780 [Tabrizicola sp. WMC-M-20]|nr:hypothetical protein EYC08_08780 [Tabrizicola sp. WMC-M-20]